ncbi:unnamed protein product [Lymnaea stagnalis]|uniref:Ig-like domain-containing protein n=1 Tax=Lymnaea stagnalis TaxID=6523 RepID=A0AAV2I334_LYMST
MKRFQILPMLALGLHLICGLSALNCNDLKWRENPVDVSMMNPMFVTNPRLALNALDCECDFEPAYEYRWTKDDKPVNESSTVLTRGPLLRFLNFSDSDEGLYKCYGLWPHSSDLDTNTLYQTVRIRQPRFERFIDKDDTVHTVQEYTYVRLECSDKGEMVGDTFGYGWIRKWFGGLDENGRMYTDLTGNLHITPVLREDENFSGTPAKFRCGIWDLKWLMLTRFGNDHSLNVTRVAVAPMSIPILQYKSENATAALYKTAKLECVFSGYHPNYTMSYSWFLPNGSSVVQTGVRGLEKYNLYFNNRRLEINDVRESDGGVYQCQAENMLGVSTREDVQLEVTCN